MRLNPLASWLRWWFALPITLFIVLGRAVLGGLVLLGALAWLAAAITIALIAAPWLAGERSRRRHRGPGWSATLGSCWQAVCPWLGWGLYGLAISGVVVSLVSRELSWLVTALSVLVFYRVACGLRG